MLIRLIIKQVFFLFVSVILIIYFGYFSGGDIKDLKILKSRFEADCELAKESTPSKLSTISYNSDCPSPVKVCSVESFTYPDVNGYNCQNNVNGYRKNGYKHSTNGQRISPTNGQRISPTNGQKVSPSNSQRSSPETTDNKRQRNGQYQKRNSPNFMNNSDNYSNRISPPAVNGKQGKGRYSPNGYYQERNSRHTPNSDSGRNEGTYTPTKEDQAMRPRLNSGKNQFNSKTNCLTNESIAKWTWKSVRNLN